MEWEIVILEIKGLGKFKSESKSVEGDFPTIYIRDVFNQSQ